MSFWSILGLVSVHDMRKLQAGLATFKEESTVQQKKIQTYLEELSQKQEGLFQKESDKICNTLENITDNARRRDSEVHNSQNAILASVSETKNCLLETEKISRQTILEGIERLTPSIEQIQGQAEKSYNMLVQVQEDNSRLKGLLVDLVSQQDIVYGKVCKRLDDLSEKLHEIVETLDKSTSEQKSLIEDTNGICLQILSLDESIAENVLPPEMRDLLKYSVQKQEQIFNVLVDAQVIEKELADMKNYLYMLWETTKLVWVNDLLNEIEGNRG